jgi:hypothetical protein
VLRAAIASRAGSRKRFDRSSHSSPSGIRPDLGQMSDELETSPLERYRFAKRIVNKSTTDYRINTP